MQRDEPRRPTNDRTTTTPALPDDAAEAARSGHASRRWCGGPAASGRWSPVRFGSLFSGSGVGDAALEEAGMVAAWQVEKDRHCLTILGRHFPKVARYGDITGLSGEELDHVDLIIGGDPCPHRSKARSIWGSNSPDLWPDFVRIVRAVRPLWVLREHVVSADADDCWADLVGLGYDALILEVDSAQVTGQSRPREYLCGVLSGAGICPAEVFSEPYRRSRAATAGKEAEPVAQCLTTHPQRYDSRDNYVHEWERGTRILVPEERERLQGFQPGWTDGLSDRQRAKLAGNAMTKPVVRWIAHRILRAHLAGTDAR